MAVKEQGIRDAVRSAIHPLWNAWYFLTLYANADGVKADTGRTSATGVLDRYVLAKLHQAVVAVTQSLDEYDISGACTAIEAFLDALTNWYIRRSRDRFWGTAAASRGDQQDAFDTLGTVLEVLCRTAAPLLPLITESVWRGLTGGDSVHLADWPDAAALPSDADLVAVMDRVRQVCSSVHSIRKAQGLRARLPLASLTVAAADAASLAPFEDLIKDEVNVRSLRLTDAVGDVANQVLSVVFRVAAPRLGPLTQQAAAAARAGDWEVLADGRARVGPAVLEPAEWELRLTPRAPDVSRVLPDEDGVVILDVVVSPELEAEGRARDLVRLVQQERRARGLRVSDRIHLRVVLSPELAGVQRHTDLIAGQVLATDLELRLLTATEAAGHLEGVTEHDIDGHPVWLHLTRAG